MQILILSMIILNFFFQIKQCKKFGKAEIKSYIDEFEEKLNKIHTDRKEQEATARNAQVHQQNYGSLEDFLTKENNLGKVTNEGMHCTVFIVKNGNFRIPIKLYDLLVSVFLIALKFVNTSLEQRAEESEYSLHVNKFKLFILSRNENAKCINTTTF